MWVIIYPLSEIPKGGIIRHLFPGSNNCHMRPLCFLYSYLTCCIELLTNIMLFCAKVKKSEHRQRHLLLGFQRSGFSVAKKCEIEIDERRYNQKWNILMINQRQIIPSLKNDSVFKVFLCSLTSEFCKTLNSQYWKWNFRKRSLHNFFLTKWNILLESIKWLLLIAYQLDTQTPGPGLRSPPQLGVPFPSQPQILKFLAGTSCSRHPHHKPLPLKYLLCTSLSELLHWQTPMKSINYCQPHLNAWVQNLLFNGSLVMSSRNLAFLLDLRLIFTFLKL